MTESAQPILAIDPGASGGYAVQPSFGMVEASFVGMTVAGRKWS